MKRGKSLLSIALSLAIILCTMEAPANTQVNAAKSILSEIQNKQDTKGGINLKDYQKPVDVDIAKWASELERKLNEDAKNKKQIIEPKLNMGDNKVALEIVEKSQSIINDSLGISDKKPSNGVTASKKKRLCIDFLIFTSFSIGEKNLEDLIKLASIYDGVVVLRGFKNNNMKDTAEFMSKFSREKEGVLIDPNLFAQYKITKVPTFVLTKPCEEGMKLNCKPIFDKLTGMVSPRYALDKFSHSGNLKEDAKERLGR